MKRILILAIAALTLSGCFIDLEEQHLITTPPPLVTYEHHVTHGHFWHGVHHHYTNSYGWKSHRSYYNPCNC